MSLNVLYVEDNQEHQEHSLELFENFFDNIDTASNGKEGLESYLKYYKINNSYYDVVISDMEMPIMNGIEMSKKIYNENIKQIIVIISAYNNPKYLINFINIGIYYFLLKPFKKNDMLNIFNQVKEKLNQNNIYKLSINLYYDSDTMSINYKNKQYNLTKKEHLLLNILTKSIDNIVSYDIIYYTLWEDDILKGSAKTLNPIISKLKKKLQDDNIIKNIYGIGYKISSYND